MTTAEKAYEIISRTGGTRHLADALTPAERAELATIHDQATDVTLRQLVADFWGRRGQRLADLKATDDVQPAAQND